MSKVYFITGANRGLGLELTKQLSSKKDISIIATARTPANATALNELAATTGTIKVIQLDCLEEKSIEALGPQVEKLAPEGVDYLINNAGISTPATTKPMMTIPKKVWTEHMETNSVAPMLVTQQLYPHLLKKSTRVLFFISSSVGSVGGFFPLPTSAYGMSKAALNHGIRSLAHELGQEGFTTVAITPGLVNTDLGVKGVAAFVERNPYFKDHAAKYMIKVEDSVSDLVKILDNLTPEDNGKFYDHDGTESPW